MNNKLIIFVFNNLISNTPIVKKPVILNQIQNKILNEKNIVNHPKIQELLHSKLKNFKITNELLSGGIEDTWRINFKDNLLFVRIYQFFIGLIFGELFFFSLYHNWLKIKSTWLNNEKNNQKKFYILLGISFIIVFVANNFYYKLLNKNSFGGYFLIKNDIKGFFSIRSFIVSLVKVFIIFIIQKLELVGVYEWNKLNFFIAFVFMILLNGVLLNILFLSASNSVIAIIKVCKIHEKKEYIILSKGLNLLNEYITDNKDFDFYNFNDFIIESDIELEIKMNNASSLGLNPISTAILTSRNVYLKKKLNELYENEDKKENK